MIKSVGETVLTKLLKLPGVPGPQWNTWYQYNIKQTSAENKEKYQNEILGEKDLNIFVAIWNCSSGDVVTKWLLVLKNGQQRRVLYPKYKIGHYILALSVF